MHQTTALILLKYLARESLLDVKMTTFVLPKVPQPVHYNDVKEAFVALADYMRFDESKVRVTHHIGMEIWTHEKLFEKLFDIIFVKEKLFPQQRHEGSEGRDAPLPNLFIGLEKTQIRQIPLSEKEPWPFRFLLELGGMIVCRSVDKRSLLLQLKQFLNNYPQYDIKVDAKEWPDGSVAIFTWWFRSVPLLERKGHVNVPPRTY